MSAPPLSRVETLRTLRISNMDVAFSAAFVTLTTGAFLVGFIQLLGGSDLWIGLLTAIPSLVGLLQIPAAVWGRRFPSFRPFVTPGGWAWRMLYVPLVALPLLPWPDPLRLTILAVCVTLAGISITIVNPIYSDWIAEIVPAESRGWYFARRNAISGIVGAVAGIVAAAALDAFRGAEKSAQGFAFVYGMGILCGFVSMGFYLRMSDVPRANPVAQNLRDGIRSVGRPFGDRAFRQVLIFLCVAIFSQTFPGNLYAAFAREALDLNFKVIQAAIMFQAIGNLLAARVWGFLSDKYGNKPIFAITGLLLALNPVPWMLCRPGADVFNATLLWSTHILMGVLWAAVALTQFNIILATAPTDDRPNYLAAGMTAIAVIGGVAPLAGAALMAELRNSLSAEMAYKAVFGGTIALRLVAVAFIVPVRESGAAGFRHTLAALRHVTPKRMRAVRTLSGTGSARARGSAIASAGEQHIAFAADDIIRALHDPVPQVRREAAAALAQLRDPRAVDELLHQLEEHPDLVEEEMVEALGALGDCKALPALERLLTSPRSLIRRSAARAMGRVAPGAGIGSPSGLLGAAADASDPDLRRAALQAVRMIGDAAAAPAIIAALSDPHPSVRIAAAEAVSEMELKSAHDALLESLRQYPDEAAAEVAYALGSVGGEADIRPIMAVAAQTVSQITRRRALLGIARILGVESATYRLMVESAIDRDTHLMRDLAPRGRRALAAMEHYGRGDESTAISMLAEENPRLKSLVEATVEDTFLVAAAVVCG